MDMKYECKAFEETSSFNTHAEESKLCIDEEDRYKITDFRETTRPSQASSMLSDLEWKNEHSATNYMKAFHVLLYAV